LVNVTSDYARSFSHTCLYRVHTRRSQRQFLPESLIWRLGLVEPNASLVLLREAGFSREAAAGLSGYVLSATATATLVLAKPGPHGGLLPEVRDARAGKTALRALDEEQFPNIVACADARMRCSVANTVRCPTRRESTRACREPGICSQSDVWSERYCGMVSRVEG
jgi:hypothetical protein